MNRRSFSGLLGGLFGGGAAAKAGIITVAPAVPPAASVIGSAGAFIGGKEESVGTVKELSNAAKYFFKRKKVLEKASLHHTVLKAVGIIPSHVRERMWERAVLYPDSTDNGLDLDVAALKSVSRVNKYRIHRERLYKKKQEEWWDSPSKALKNLIIKKNNPLERAYWDGDSPYMFDDDEFSSDEGADD